MYNFTKEDIQGGLQERVLNSESSWDYWSRENFLISRLCLNTNKPNTKPDAYPCKIYWTITGSIEMRYIVYKFEYNL